MSTTVQRAGLEWAFRLARRYLARCLPEAFILFAGALRKRLRHALRRGSRNRPAPR
ncbi:MAG: hypothetical protein L0Z55_09040 [Planctomycetes bacterium]|nr:hypothetical protein [Planctomycetota bacterium]